MRIIGFTGPMASGKTTAATTLYQSDPARYKIAPMAETLKNMVRCIGADPDDKDAEFAPGVTNRRLMQTLGTEWGRCRIHEDIWLWAWLRMHDREQRTLLIDDVRFENEANFVRRHGVLIHITRLPWGGSHASERGVTVEPQDWAMSDTRDLGMLQHIARGSGVAAGP